jgi:hypothetical protein
MDRQRLHACITYIACRLITGKRPAFLYDIQNLKEIEMAGILDLDFLRDFDEKFCDYIPGYSNNCTCRCIAGENFTTDIFINEKTFIVHVNGTAAYFIGNLRNDMVYLYDHRESTHFRYRITAYMEDHRKEEEKPAGEAMYGDD